MTQMLRTFSRRAAARQFAAGKMIGEGTSCVIQRDGDTLILTPTFNMGELDYDRFARDLDVVFELFENPHIKNVVIDFRNTDYFGSRAIGLFERLWKVVEGKNGKTAFSGASARQLDILQALALDHLWQICGSKEAALAEVRGREVRLQITPKDHTEITAGCQ